MAFYGGLLFSGLVLIAFGFRGVHLFYGVLLTAVPVVYLGANFLKYLIPPGIELYLPDDNILQLRDKPRS
jgi:hypothetical protein